MFLVTLVAPHFTPVSESVAGLTEFQSSVALSFASLLQLQFNFKKQKIPVIVHLPKVDGEVMCNSIMAVAHGVMLTCDLVYNRCHF